MKQNEGNTKSIDWRVFYTKWYADMFTPLKLTEETRIHQAFCINFTIQQDKQMKIVTIWWTKHNLNKNCCFYIITLKGKDRLSKIFSNGEMP